MSGRVQYTIAGLDPILERGPDRSIGQARASQPISPPQPTAGLDPNSSVRPGVDAATVESWSEVLGINRPQPGDLMLEPPRAPVSITYSDADEVRRQWGGMLRRHAVNAGSVQLHPNEMRMWTALAYLHEQENDLQADILAEPRD